MSVNARELLVGWGKGKQSDIDTANLVGAIWRLNKINTAPLDPQFITEDDAAESGKGHEFATATYKSHVLIGPHPIEKFLSSEIMAWAAAFGLGACVKTGSGPYVYTCTPQVPATAGIETPYFSYIEQIRPGGSAIWDKMYPGCRVAGFLVSLITAPGRASSKITIDMVGSGKITEPSAITLPAKTTEKELPAASLAFTSISVNYVSLKCIISLEWGWNNNVRESTGFYPGSGTQSGYAKKGRIENGDRMPVFRFVARCRVGTPEYTLLIALTTGTAVITQTYDADNTYTATFHQLAYKSVQIGDDEGLVTISVEGSPMYHTSNGVLTVVATTAVDGICDAPA